jgi:hypothetical protein
MIVLGSFSTGHPSPVFAVVLSQPIRGEAGHGKPHQAFAEEEQKSRRRRPARTTL